jgi:VCBS repeat-containing protein
MHINVKRLRVPAISLILAACVLLPAHVTLKAGYPHGASYDPDSSRMFWFLQASDLHIGMSGTNDTTSLQWLVTTARSVINPSFIVVTGDLTDSTNGNWLGIPNGPYQAEWDQYKSILTSAGMNAGFYYDLPGNHDAYSDAAFAYYRANSVQGRATGGTQVSWTRTFPFGTYHFLGVNSAGNDGRAFSITSPYGDYAGLDGTELTFINQALSANTSAVLTFAFGHHPVSNTGNSQDTWLYYGHQEFVQALGTRSVSTYNYGHTHKTSQELFKGNSYTGLMAGDGLYYYNVASLSKDSPTGYSLVAVDANGVSSITNAVSAWPLLLITSPLDKYVGSGVNPYAYTVPAAGTNFVRALVFDSGAISQVRFRIDSSATWYVMSRVATGSPVWQGTWDASALAAGNHTIEVQAAGTTTVTDAVTVEVTGAGNRPPVAAGDSYSTSFQTPLTVAAPGVLANDGDPDGNSLTAAPAAGPGHGTVTLNAAGGFTYTPAASFSGTDTFTYTASDGTAISAPATVSITVKPQSDVVTIVSATYNARRKTLSVTATSSVQPSATLTVVGYGQMTYKTKTKTYTFTAALASKPASVTVTSSLGGSATAAVN